MAFMSENILLDLSKEYAMTPSGAERNKGFDCLRLLCTFCVVCIHTPYAYKVLVEPAIRFAVPVFFLISGWFYSGVCARGNQVRQIKKIFRLFLWGNLGGWAFWLLCRKFLYGDFSEYWAIFCSPESWVKFLIWNQPPVMDSMWYLGAFLYVLVLVRLCDRDFGREKLYPLIPLLLAGNFLLGNYSLPLFGQEIPHCYSRNFLLMGLPFFLLGDLLARKPLNIRNCSLLLIFAGATFLALVENYILYKTDLLFNCELSLFTAIAAVALFLIVARNPGWFSGRIFSGLARAGKELSLWIYILHPAVIIVVKYFLNIGSALLAFILPVYGLLSPVIIFSVTVPLAAAVHRLESRKTLIKT